MSRRELHFGPHTVALEHADKVLFPELGITKGDLADYYVAVAAVMLPHLTGRPVTLERYPDGVGKNGFFQKETPHHFPDFVPRSTQAKEGGSTRYTLVENTATLAYLVGQGTITPHVWLSRADRPKNPDRMIFDLDPPQGGFGLVLAAARELRAVLEKRGYYCQVMTTGSKGLHVVVPLGRSADFDQVRAEARDIASELESDRFTLEQRKDKRDGRLYLDVMRNGYAQTTVAPYAVRARQHASVAVPLDWDELDDDLRPDGFSMQSVLDRLEQREDPWKGLGRHARRLR